MKGEYSENIRVKKEEMMGMPTMRVVRRLNRIDRCTEDDSSALFVTTLESSQGTRGTVINTYRIGENNILFFS